MADNSNSSDSAISRLGAHTPGTVLASQVGGHAGVEITEDGSLIIKPALPLEAAFYAQLAANPPLAPLRPFTPKFLGTLKLDDQSDDAQGVQKESLVLENLSHPFTRPNILDIKLGTVLYDQDASEEKRARMDKAARSTTSHETGVRLTGFQVYDNNTGEPVPTGKAYGKSIKPADLPDGMRRFFPTPTSDSAQGLPPATLLPILQAIHDVVEEVREVWADLELRMVGGSLLVVYEADHKRAGECIAWMEKRMDAAELGIDEDEEDDEEEEEESNGEHKKPGAPFTVKLIDFAHTRLVPGEGPDKGVLLGLDTTLGLLDGRIKEVEVLVS